MEIINKDLLTIDEGIIAHSVNCQGVMGSGVAKLIREKYPDAYIGYLEMCRDGSPKSLLGKCQVIQVSDKLSVANLFCQFDYNRRSQNDKHTNYGAVAQAFGRLNARNVPFSPIYIPYLMGCDRGGADWEVFTEIVDQVCDNVIACKL